jgi:hypothetical protein
LAELQKAEELIVLLFRRALTSAILRMLGRTNGAITFDLHSSVSGGNTLDTGKWGNRQHL